MAYLVIMALFIRVAVSGIIFLISRDGVRFIMMAKALADHNLHAFTAEQYHPLYPVFIYLTHFISSDWTVAARMAAVIMGALCLIPLYHITRALFDDRVARIALFVYALHPYAVRFSADALSESTYIFFVLSAVWIGYKACVDGIRPVLALASGGLIACAYLTRPEGMGVLFAVTAAFVLYRRDPSLKRVTAKRIAAVALVCFGVMLVSFPYIYTLKQTTGEWRITTKKPISHFVPTFIKSRFIKPEETPPVTQQPAVTEQADSPAPEPTAEPQAAEPAQPVSPAQQQPSFASGVMRRIGALGEFLDTFFNTYHPLLFILFLIGIPGAYRQRDRSRRLLVYMILGLFVLYGYVLYRLTLVHYISKRHVLPLVTLLIPMCACGIDTLANTKWLRQKFKGRIKPVHVLIILVLVVLAPKTFKPLRDDKQFIRDISNWIIINGDLQGAYAVDDPRIAFYAQVPFTTLPRFQIGERELTGFLDHHGIDYLVLSEEHINEYVSGLNQMESAGKLKLISIYKHTDNKTGKKYLLYEYVRSTYRL